MATDSPIIISRPELQTRMQRTLFGALTFALWMLWIYLWLPLLTAFLWILGVHAAYVNIFRGARGVSLTNLVWVLLVVIVVVTYWSNYNRIRYGRSTRRRRRETVSKVAVARRFGITEAESIADLTQGRHLELRFSCAGELIQVEAVTDTNPKILMESDVLEHVHQ